MMMNKGAVSSSLMWVVMMVLLVAAVHEAEAVDCNPTALTPCLGAISGGQDPSQDCCNKLKEQQPCFCQYLKNPVFKPYIDSPNAKKVVAKCGVAIPSC